MLQQIILAIVSVLIPIGYQLFIAQFPDFPLALGDIANLVEWLINLAFGGAAGYFATNARRISQIEKGSDIVISGQVYKASKAK